MRIDNFNRSTEGCLARVSGTVTWEDSDRPAREIYIETNAHFVDDISPNPNAFLLAAIMPAMHHGEKRILLDGKLCPQLRNGVITALQQLQKWYGGKGHQPVTIEATEGFEPPLPRPTQRTASFLSGGVDALSTLRGNRLDFPLGHPGSIQDCFFVHGFDLGGYVTLPDNRENSHFAISLLTEFAWKIDVNLIPVYTNVRHLDDNDDMFFIDWFGAALASVAHAFSNRIGTAFIASSSSVEALGPMGSHPMLDPCYSSSDVSIRHDGIRFSRLKKVGLIAEWDEALQTLRACFDAFRPGNSLNCGKCEKCLRTMTELLVFGKLKQCTTYPYDNVSPDLLQTINAAVPTKRGATRKEELEEAYCRISGGNVDYWRELKAPLRKIGRHDLVDVIDSKLADYEKFRAWTEEKDWKGRVKRLDRKCFGGIMFKLHQHIKRDSLTP